VSVFIPNNKLLARRWCTSIGLHTHLVNVANLSRHTSVSSNCGAYSSKETEVWRDTLATVTRCDHCSDGRRVICIGFSCRPPNSACSHNCYGTPCVQNYIKTGTPMLPWNWNNWKYPSLQTTNEDCACDDIHASTAALIEFPSLAASWPVSSI